MYYKLLLYAVPLPVIVFLWNSGLETVDALDSTAKLFFSIILVLLTVGGYIDVYTDDWQSPEDVD